MIRSTLREGRLYVTLAALTVLLAGADIWYFTSTPPPQADGPTVAAPALRTPDLAVSDAPIVYDAALVCAYNLEVPAVADYESLISPTDVVEGNAESKVTVIEFFEPNCPHCRTFYPTMRQLVAQYGDRARFVIKPVVFWDKSVLQGQALYAAAAEGKFDAMLAAQFSMPKPDGLAEADVRGIARMIGMDADAMMRSIEAGEYRPMTFAARQAFQASGNRSVPAVLINGRTVSHEARTAECLAKMIDEAAAAE